MTQAAISPFNAALEGLVNNGYHVLPIQAKEKRILEFTWQKWARQKPTPRDIDNWKARKDANIGICLGSIHETARGQAQLVAFDIDTQDGSLFEAIVNVLPPSPMAKKGAKGLTLFYLGSLDLKSTSVKEVFDFLAEGKQTVMPPSIHPQGMAYEYHHEGLVPADELPFLSQAHIDAVKALLLPKEESVKVIYSPSLGDDSWQEVNDAAMQNLSTWVTSLGLSRLVKLGNRYAAVATWRGSMTGRPTEKRARNLSIHHQGIKDFGSDETFSPIDLVMRARNLTNGEALTWLSEQLVIIAPVYDIDIKATVKENLTVEEESEEFNDENNEYDFPEEKLLFGGLVQWGADLAMERMPYPNRLWATIATMTAIGTILGRKVVSVHGRAPTRMYSLIYGDTAIGKQHPQDILSCYLRVAGVGSYVSTDQTSGIALAMRLQRTPNTVQIADEVHTVLSQFVAAKVDSPKYALMTTLNTVWGATSGSVALTGSTTRDGGFVHKPNLSLFWATVTGDFHKCLTETLFTNGFYNRFGVYPRYTYVEKNKKMKDIDDLPSEFVDALKTLVKAEAKQNELISQQDPERTPTQFVIGYSRKAHDLLDAWEDENGKIVRRQDGVDKEFIVRRIRQIETMALIIACGKHYANLHDATIEVDDLNNARALIDWSIEQLKTARDNHMISSSFQGQCKIVVDCFKGKKKLLHKDLYVKIDRKLNMQQVADCIKYLVAEERISVTKIGAATKPTQEYKLIRR